MNNLSDRTEEEDKLEDAPTANGTGASRSSSQEDIIALFRRIQSSISEGGLKVSKKRGPSNLKQKQSAESVLGALRNYPTKKQVRAPSQEENRESPRSKATSDDKMPEDAPLSLDFKVLRPVSNFVKRSPIRPPLPTKENLREVLEEQLTAAGVSEGPELQKINEMKLPELKELAKTKGVKGYSKLKKGELIEALKGVLQSSP